MIRKVKEGSLKDMKAAKKTSWSKLIIPQNIYAEI